MNSKRKRSFLLMANQSYTSLLLIIVLVGLPLVRLDCPPLLPRQGINVICTLPPWRTAHPNAHAPPDFSHTTSQPSSNVTDCYTSYVPEGTTATYSCSPYYIPLKTIEQMPPALVCKTNSSRWSGLEAFQSFFCELDCGKSHHASDITTFIIKGNKTAALSWPWHAGIYKLSEPESSEFDSTSTFDANANANARVNETSFNETDDSFGSGDVSTLHPSYFPNEMKSLVTGYHCGGTLVHAYHLGFVVLTAAHCFMDGNYNTPFGPEYSQLFQIVLGGESSSMDKNLANPNAQIFSVEQIYVHESYTPLDEKHLNDIAILKLSEPVVLSEWVRPVCMTSSEILAEKMLRTGNTGEVVGFGRRDEVHAPSPKLVHATIPVVDKLECLEHLNRHLESGQICAGYISEKTSVCSGDSGGGLVFPLNVHGSTRYFIQGIVSYGYKTCEKYAVFTKITHYMDWLRHGFETMFDQEINNQISDDDGEQQLNQVEASTIASIPEPSCPVIEKTDLHPRPHPATSIEQPKRPESNCDCIIGEKIFEIDIQVTGPDGDDDPVPFLKNSTRRLSLPVSVPVNVIHDYEYPDYQTIALTMHNHYRYLHGSPPLELNNLLNIEAKRYADKLIRENTFVNLNDYSPATATNTYTTLPYIKNIFELKEFHKHRPMQPAQVVRQAIKHWYADIESYNWYSPTTSTFSQIVWKATRQIGVGFSSTVVAGGSGGGPPNNNLHNFRSVVVVAYAPPGNTIGIDYHRKNVSPRIN